MRSVVRRITRPSSRGQVWALDREDKPRPSRRRFRSVGRTEEPRRALLRAPRPRHAGPSRPEPPEAASSVPRPVARHARAADWIGAWHSGTGIASIEVRVGRRATGGFVLHLLVGSGHDLLHRLLFAADEGEVAVLVTEIDDQLVTGLLRLPPLVWREGDGKPAA